MTNRTVIEKVSISSENPKGEQEVVIEKNTNERALVRIQVPTRTMTLSEIAKERDEDEDKNEDKADDTDNQSPANEREKKSETVPSRLSRVPSEKIIEQD